MNLASVVEKLSSLAKELEANKGPLELLGLFLREDSLDLWDLVIAAPWLKGDERDSFNYVADRLREVMTGEELAGLSRIVILDHGGAVLDSFLKSFAGRIGQVDDVNFSLSAGPPIRRAYIILARPVVKAARAGRAKHSRRRKASP